MQEQQVGKSMVRQQMMASSTHLWVALKGKKKRRRIQKQFLVEGEGVQRSSFVKEKLNSIKCAPEVLNTGSL